MILQPDFPPVSLAPRLSVGSYIHQYNRYSTFPPELFQPSCVSSEGYLLYQRAGRAAKVCARKPGEGEGAQEQEQEQEQERRVKELANTTCAALEYESLSWAAVARDEEKVEDIQYVGMDGLVVGADFAPLDCPDR